MPLRTDEFDRCEQIVHLTMPQRAAVPAGFAAPTKIEEQAIEAMIHSRSKKMTNPTKIADRRLSPSDGVSLLRPERPGVDFENKLSSEGQVP